MKRPEERRPHRREEGFTLIELGVVLAIIAILVAIAVPTYVNMVNRAHTAEAQQAWDMVKSEVWSSYLEHNNAFPDASGGWFAGIDQPKSTSGYWTYKAASVNDQNGQGVAAGMEADHSSGDKVVTSLCWSIDKDGLVTTGTTLDTATATCSK